MAQIKTNLQYGVTGSLQTGSIAGDAIDGTKIADDAINSEHLAAGGIDTAHIADDQITLAKMASGTDGNVITYDASGNPAVVSTGTSGHFLKSQGAGSVPVFAAAAGGVNTPYIYIKVGSNQSVSDNTITKVEFDTEIFDTEGSFDSSTNYRWTPQTAGKYYICAGVGMTAFGVDQLNETSIYIYKNGSKDMQSRITTATHYLYWLTPVVSSIVDMNGSSDYVEIMGLSDFISATVSFQASSHSFLCGYKLIE